MKNVTTRSKEIVINLRKNKIRDFEIIAKCRNLPIEFRLGDRYFRVNNKEIIAGLNDKEMYTTYLKKQIAKKVLN